jgi:transporter family-2 protein
MMTRRSTDCLVAFAGGMGLAVMVHCNSLAAQHTTPAFASWVAHGIGAVIALLLVAVAARATHGAGAAGGSPRERGPPPVWAYLGGVPGTLAVILAAVTVNSRLGLAGAVALMQLGQVLFGLVDDVVGLFSTPTRRIRRIDLLVAICILSGSAMIIFGRGDR